MPFLQRSWSQSVLLCKKRYGDLESYDSPNIKEAEASSEAVKAKEWTDKQVTHSSFPVLDIQKNLNTPVRANQKRKPASKQVASTPLVQKQRTASTNDADVVESDGGSECSKKRVRDLITPGCSPENNKLSKNDSGSSNDSFSDVEVEEVDEVFSTNSGSSSSVSRANAVGSINKETAKNTSCESGRTKASEKNGDGSVNFVEESSEDSFAHLEKQNYLPS